jgi:hypothetical protein
MGFPLPTDTQHLQLETRQYELFNRPLGQGIVRRRLYVGVVVCAVWCGLLLLVGVSPMWRLGPALYIVPPFAAVYLGTRAGEDGRMVAMRWYDAVLSRAPGRRRRVRNPLLGSASREPAVLRVDRQMTELHPHTGRGASLTPLVGRRTRTPLQGEIAGETSTADTAAL